jgi:hypothetical protein
MFWYFLIIITEELSSSSNCEQVRLNDAQQARILKFIEMNV